MKYKIDHKLSRNAGWLASLIVAALLLPLSNAFADDIEEIKETALIVNIKDPYGLLAPKRNGYGGCTVPAVKGRGPLCTLRLH